LRGNFALIEFEFGQYELPLAINLLLQRNRLIAELRQLEIEDINLLLQPEVDVNWVLAESTQRYLRLISQIMEQEQQAWEEFVQYYNMQSNIDRVSHMLPSWLERVCSLMTCIMNYMEQQDCQMFIWPLLL